MGDELRMQPDKWEMARVINKWVIERAGIDHARLPNLHRLNTEELKLLVLAMGYKLDLQDFVNLQRWFSNEWERVHGKRADVVVPRPIALPDESNS